MNQVDRLGLQRRQNIKNSTALLFFKNLTENISTLRGGLSL